MKVRSTAFTLAAVLAGISAAAAQSYPSRPVTMVVPFAAGGPVDTIARIVGAPMGKVLGQTIVVENVVGASGTLGVGRVARAAPDGYTLSIGHWGTHVINGAVYPLQYDLLKDLERSEEHTSELQSRLHLVCRLLLEKKKNNNVHI